MNKLIKSVVCLGIIVGLSGCTDAYVGQWTSFGKPGKITLYSGGVAVKSWVSTGKIHTESESDGYYFIDKDSNKLVRVSGDVVIEQ